MSDREGADCVFCSIVEGRLPAEIVAQNEHAIAIRDLNPVAPIHVLVMPRRHLVDATGLGIAEAEVAAAMLELANQVARDNGIADSGFRLVANVGSDGGNTVSHLHFHVLGGRALGWPPG